MQRIIKTTPEVLMREASAFMVNAGATIEGRDENSMTFSAGRGVSGAEQLIGGVTAMFDFGAAMSHSTTVAASQHQTASLVIVPVRMVRSRSRSPIRRRTSQTCLGSGFSGTSSAKV